MSVAARLGLSFGGTILYLGAAIFTFGGWNAFFSHPPLVALAIVMVLLSAAAVFAGGNLSPGVREDRGNRWVLIPIIGLGLAGAFVPAWTDRIGFWTVDGEAVRWAGVALTLIGGTLRLAPVFVLGNRFSGLVAIQPNHTLVTDGLYRYIRHPSYLGLIVISIGWALAFRSLVGVLLALSSIPPIVARIQSEEKLLRSEFGAEYDAYRAKTFRLIPGLY
ncbi:MAG TPA: isoprenylcysteine carboxylmethyltransferase family protein [Candidatus Cybelea sp.]|nr:isoprenylcysteine carboxylmethyltransferase family protein [Candidatus Cybelea sp.]